MRMALAHLGYRWTNLIGRMPTLACISLLKTPSDTWSRCSIPSSQPMGHIETSTFGLSRNLTRADHPVNVLGCVDQYQVCNPATSSCSSPGGLYHLIINLVENNTLGLNSAQLASATRLHYASLSSKTYSSVEGLGAGGRFSDVTYGRHPVRLLISIKLS